MRAFIVLSLLTLSFSCLSNTPDDNNQVNEFDQLKATPATLYDIGKLRLEIQAAFLTQKKAGERVKGTKFDVKGISIVEREDSLGIQLVYAGKSKYVTRSNCLDLQDASQRRFNTEKLVKDTWPMLGEDQHKALSKEMFLSTKVIDKDNPELFSICE